MNGVGIVIIGRNEGDRLRRCLASVCGLGLPVVYADSASTDGSCELARGRGVSVVALDESKPLTAARGRNAGFEKLLQIAPELEFVQFVDGDCEIADKWIERAAADLHKDSTTAAVCGKLTERDAQTSIYKRLCAMEWNGSIGEIQSCGGIFVARTIEFLSAGGFNASLPFGEEAELCERWRAKGMKITRIDTPMATHDAGITRFSQWWRRTTRAGWAHMHHLWLNGLRSDSRRVAAMRSVLIYAVVIPLVALALLWKAWWFALPVFAVPYIVLAVRVRRARRRQGDAPDDARLYAAFCVLAKFAEFVGVMRFLIQWLKEHEQIDRSQQAHPTSC